MKELSKDDTNKDIDRLIVENSRLTASLARGKKMEAVVSKFKKAFNFYDPYNHRGNQEQWQSLVDDAFRELEALDAKEDVKDGN